MISNQEAIRNAAILVAALDVPAADALLESMDPQTAAQVRACVMELDDVDPAEEQAVIEHFLGRGEGSEAATEDAAEDSAAGSAHELDGAVGLADFLNANREESGPTSDVEHHPQDDSPTPDSSPFEFLQSAPQDTLYGVLRHEHPQAIAVVLAHVAPELGARVMERLSPRLQADVARRIIHLEPVDRETLRVLESGLEELIGAQLVHHSRQSGLATMQNILSATTGAARTAIVSNLHQREAVLVADAGAKEEIVREAPVDRAHVAKQYETQDPRPKKSPAAGATSATSLEFEDLTQLSDADLGRVLHKAGGRLLLLALAGASDELMQRVYHQLPRREAGLLRRQIEQQGPISLRDVEAAQHRLARLASAMADEGTIDAPPQKRFAVAA